MKWLKHWWPALVWAVVISGFSTGAFTSDNTSRFIVPILRFFLPHASAETLELLHFLVRKCAHFTEYFILSLLILRGIRAGAKGMHLRWALLSILLVAGYASLDEFHQSFVPGRTAAVGDVLIDTSGGAVALIVASLFARFRRDRDFPRQDESTAVGAVPSDTT
jgi:VanZ family protein